VIDYHKTAPPTVRIPSRDACDRRIFQRGVRV
jgi:hypothetical protein